MDTSTRKFTVRRWFSIYLKNKAARNKSSPGFCQLEVSDVTLPYSKYCVRLEVDTCAGVCPTNGM